MRSLGGGRDPPCPFRALPPMKTSSLRVLCASLLLLATAPSGPAQERVPIRVAIALFPGAQILDFTGPWETFVQAGYRVYTAAATTEPVLTNGGMRLLPDHAFADAPEADILVIPGGAVPHRLPENDPLVRWVKGRAEGARYVLTVCNGSFVLGPTGLARGRSITTNAGMIGHLEAFVDGATAVYDRRFVADGKLVTAGGLCAGIDAALHLVGEIDSPGRAREVANKMEYDWRPEAGYARSKLADFDLYRALDFAPPLRKKVLRYEGDETHWTADFLVRRPVTLEAFAAELEESARSLDWTPVARHVAEREIELVWTYADPRGAPWKLTARFLATEASDEHRMVLEIERR